MTDLHLQPPRPLGPVPSGTMDDEAGPDPEEVRRIADQYGVWRSPTGELAAKPAPNYPRSIYWSVNLILLVLVPILLILGWHALKQVKADRQEQQRVEICEDWEATSDIVLDMCR